MKNFEILGELPEWRDMKWTNVVGKMMPTELLYKVATHLQFVKKKKKKIAIICKMQWSKVQKTKVCLYFLPLYFPLLLKNAAIVFFLFFFEIASRPIPVDIF